MNKQEKQELFMLQVRLFRQAQIAWNLSARECSQLFTRYDVYGYIAACYGFYHVQGDEANLADIKDFLAHKGVVL